MLDLSPVPLLDLRNRRVELTEFDLESDSGRRILKTESIPSDYAMSGCIGATFVYQIEK